jgi:hypothetical protein
MQANILQLTSPKPTSVSKSNPPTSNCRNVFDAPECARAITPGEEDNTLLAYYGTKLTSDLPGCWQNSEAVRDKYRYL